MVKWNKWNALDMVQWFSGIVFYKFAHDTRLFCDKYMFTLEL